MIHKKKLKYLENTIQPPPIDLRDRQNNYINIVRKKAYPLKQLI